jgi:organic radical activating enzyme
MISLPVVEFYITNVCNLTCRGCNRFNNYNFKGHQYWNEYANEYSDWSKRLNFDHITIIGGEPTLNPELELWVSNLRRLWPNSNIMIQTNGTYIRPNFSYFWEKYNVGFAISLHDTSTAEDIFEAWQQSIGSEAFLKGFVFHQPAIIEQDDSYVLHQSDKDQAFNCCDMKYDHTMHRGKLYKCPTMGILPEFGTQFNLKISNKQQELLREYQPLESNCSIDQLNQFIQNRDSAIDQCEFCPSQLKWQMALGEEINPTMPADFGVIHPSEIKFLKSPSQYNK